MLPSPDDLSDFRWDEKIHGTAETFLIIVEDVDGEINGLDASLYLLCSLIYDTDSGISFVAW
jgi:hypothetical protein